MGHVSAMVSLVLRSRFGTFVFGGKIPFPGNIPAQRRALLMLESMTASSSRHGPAVDDILCAGNGGGARRSQKRDQIGMAI